jgi:hypothetical protein
MYLSKDVRIRGYCAKPKWVRQQKSLGKTGLKNSLRVATSSFIPDSGNLVYKKQCQISLLRSTMLLLHLVAVTVSFLILHSHKLYCYSHTPLLRSSYRAVSFYTTNLILPGVLSFSLRNTTMLPTQHQHQHKKRVQQCGP